MAIFGRGYDQEYDRGFRQTGPGYRGNWNRPGGGFRDEGPWDSGNDGQFGWGPGPRSNPRRFNRYDNTMRPRYDRGFRGSWADQERGGFANRPPEGPFRFGGGNFQRYDRGFEFGARYDRTFRGNDRQFRDSGFPMGYQPYSVREGYDTGFRGNNFPRRDHPWY